MREQRRDHTKQTMRIFFRAKSSRFLSKELNTVGSRRKRPEAPNTAGVRFELVYSFLFFGAHVPYFISYFVVKREMGVRSEEVSPEFFTRRSDLCFFVSYFLFVPLR